MIVLDKHYWENRCIENSTGWDLGHASRPIKEYIDSLINTNLKILIPGAGNSYEATYLLKLGFTNVKVLDIAKIPLQNLEDRLQDTSQIHLVQDNFFNHQGSYDLIIEQTFFCALEFRFRESYFQKASQLLNKNGRLAGVLFNFDQERTAPPYGGNKEEYNKLSSPYFKIIKMENCNNSEPSRQGKELFFKLVKR